MIISAQHADGYLNIHYSVVEKLENRFTNFRDMCELLVALPWLTYLSRPTNDLAGTMQGTCWKVHSLTTITITTTSFCLQ